jgi:hypothetical protein
MTPRWIIVHSVVGISPTDTASVRHWDHFVFIISARNLRMFSKTRGYIKEVTERNCGLVRSILGCHTWRTESWVSPIHLGVLYSTERNRGSHRSILGFYMYTWRNITMSFTVPFWGVILDGMEPWDPFHFGVLYSTERNRGFHRSIWVLYLFDTATILYSSFQRGI